MATNTEKPRGKSEQRETKIRIYSEILSEIKNVPEAEEFGVTFAVNKILALGLNLPEPVKPVQRKSAGGRRSGSIRKKMREETKENAEEQ